MKLVTDQAAISKNFGTRFSYRDNSKNSTEAPLAANVYVGGRIDVSGRFVNDIGRVAGIDAVGPAFLNGGSISISTNKSSEDLDIGYLDTTGSILLGTNSVLDVSSGGYISPQGKARTVASGTMEG
ncbi:hypothetical protein EGT07_34060, partial [Herbaspirillum sp. HC18]